jgi:predicted Zn-dependent protease
MRDAYERVVAPRLLAYELEADRIAAVLLAQSGYDPHALGRLSAKVASLPRERKDLFDPDYLAPDDATARANAIAKFIEQAYPQQPAGTTMKERFMTSTRALR